MSETTDEPVCGYVRAEGVICYEPRSGVACAEHELSIHQVCSGCGSKAFRECSQELPGGNLCRRALCYSCGHLFDESHGAVADAPMDEPGARQKTPPPGVLEMREDLVAATSRNLAKAQADGKISFTGKVSADDIARELVDGLATYTALMGLSAIAMGVQS